MTTAIEVLRAVSLVLYLVLGAAAFVQWRRTRVPPAAWATAAFLVLGGVAVAGWVLPGQERVPGTYVWEVKAVVVALAIFPYLLYRFATSFERASARLDRAAGGITIGLIAWSIALRDFPQHGDPATPLWIAYTIAFLAQWSVLFITVTARLWRAGRTRSLITKMRTRMMAVGAAGMNVAIIISGSLSARSQASTIASQAIAITSGLLLLAGLAPPRILRHDWLRRDSQALMASLLTLINIERHSEVADTMMPDAARLVGATGIALVRHDGTVIGAHGVDEQTALGAGPDTPRVLTFEMRTARMLVWTGPYTGFFGRDEIDLLMSISSVMDMALERCDKAADERRFIANAAHELRTPLTTLSGLSVTLATQRHRLTDEEIEECFDALARQGERTRVLVENLLDLAQLEDRDAPVIARTVFPAELADRALETAPPPLGREVRNAIPRDLTASADEARVEQMLINLLTNAYRYGGTTITIEGISDGDRSMIVVSDDGPGVPADLAPQLFEPFGRGSIGSNEGSGLGLAIVRRIANAFGGEIRYEAERPNGARFIITLPREAVA